MIQGNKLLKLSFKERTLSLVEPEASKYEYLLDAKVNAKLDERLKRIPSSRIMFYVQCALLCIVFEERYAKEKR